MNSVILFFCSMLVGIGVIFSYNLLHARQQVQTAKKALPSPVVQDTDFSLEKAPSDSLKAMITSFAGDVFWESRVASEPSRLTKDILFKQGETIETGENGSVVASVPQVLLLGIERSTKLSLIQTLPQNLVLAQISGSVTYTKLGDSPISIRSLRLLTVLESGEVRVVVNDEDGIVSVAVIKGAATLAFNDADFVVTKVSLSTGEGYVFYNETRTGEIVE